jgi:hypothetical protein
VTKKDEPSVEPRVLYPLQEGNAWSYDVDSGERSTTLAITRVESFDGRRARVRTGEATIEYEMRPEGIYVLSENVWLVRAPLREGATWPARGGRTATVVSMSVRVETAAGPLERCVEVLEVGGDLDLEVRTVYCPGVGPAAIASTMRSRVSERTLTVSARLRGYEVEPTPDPTR